MNNTTIFLGLIIIILIIFWIIQFISMLRSEIKAEEKGLWFIIFAVFPVLSAIVWWIVKR